jgi:hypothetical protein
MSEWISRKMPPKSDCLCLVMNTTGWMSNVLAFYHIHYDVFTPCDSRCDGLTLDVTHYLIIPARPK